MAELDRDEYKFPDEQPEAAASKATEDPIEIEVVDDTPREDQGRKPLAEAVPEPTDDELAKYDEGVQKRIKKLSHGYHDERRAKEAALREREEAFRYAQHILAENAKLKDSLGGHTKLLVDTAKQNAMFALEEAKRKYKAAYDAGDADQVVEAQEALTQAKIRLDKVENFQLPATASVPTVPTVPTPSPPPQEPAPDAKAVAWREQNPWFGRDRLMTAFALALHEELVSNGVDTQSPRYYNSIDSRLREKFPENFEAPRRQSSVVAPASRSVAPRKVTLTQTQVALAKKFKIPLELYARKVLEAQNG